MRKLQWGLLVLFGMAGIAQAGAGWNLVIEPKFLRSEVSWPVEGSDRTVLAAARVVDGEVEPVRRAEMNQSGVTTESILLDASRSASAVLAALRPEYIRDGHQVIQYAVLRSDNPLTASAVLAPEFAATFAETIGPELLLAIPNRNTVFVFPKQSLVYRTFADTMFAEYQGSAHPVSRELFELRGGKLIAIGLYR